MRKQFVWTDHSCEDAACRSQCMLTKSKSASRTDLGAELITQRENHPHRRLFLLGSLPATPRAVQPSYKLGALSCASFKTFD
jgi:hypothetical protein